MDETTPPLPLEAAFGQRFETSQTSPKVDTGDREWDLTFERSPIGMAVVLPDGSWARVNQALCLMLGRTAVELTACTFQDITHPADLAADVELLEACLAGRRDGYRMTKRYLKADGQLVWGDLSVALVRHPDGQPLHFVSQILDVTEQRADRDRLEETLARLGEANRDLEAFASIASHELKSPLTGVRASLELIADLLHDPDPEAIDTATGLAARAEQAVDRMATLLDALLALTMTKASTGPSDASERVAELTPVTIATIVDATLTDLPTSLRRADVSIERDDLLADAPLLKVEPNLVRTVLTTLISNAVKYRYPDRHLTITIEASRDADPRFTTVCVSNDGPPIAPADRERVFALHSRGAASKPVAGAGIGLAVSKSIVEWHGGRVWLDDGPAAGVGVHFTLPLAQPPAQNASGTVGAPGD